MTALGRIERSLPLAVVGVAAILLFSRLALLGLWDPWELDAADRARDAVALVDAPSLSGIGIRAGLALFGDHEWAGRLFGAVGMFTSVICAIALARRVVDGRGAAYAGVVAASTPLVILHSQLMLGDGVAIGLHSLLGLAVTGFVFPYATTLRRARAERATWFVLAITTGLLVALTRGVLLGVLAPLVAMLAIVITAPPKDRDTRVASAIVGVAALALTIITVLAVRTDAPGYANWLGGAPIGTAPPTFDAGIENIFHSLAPWSPLLVIAIIRTLTDSSESASIKRAYVLWGVFAWLAYVVFSSRYGVPTYLAIAPMAALGGVCLRELEDEATPDRVSAVVVLLFFGLIIRDFALYPTSPLSSLPVDNLVLPVGFDARKSWAVAIMLVGLPLALSLAVAGGRRDFELALFPTLRAAFSRDRAARFWIILGALVLVGCAVFGVTVALAGERLGMGSLITRLGLPIASVGPLILVGYVAMEAAVASWSRLGRYRMAPAVLGGLLFGAWVGFGFTSQASSHFSPLELYETYSSLRQPGDVLLDYHTGGRASRYYAPQPIEVIADQQTLIRKLAEQGRRWALFPRGDLQTVDREFRRLRGEHLFVADASSDRFILVTNSRIGNRQNASPLANAILSEPPRFQHRVGARFGDAIELLGYDLELPGGETVGPGQTFYVTWYWRARARPPGAQTIFLHVDGAGKRLNGDHVPVDGLVPVQMWDPGDVIVDRQLLVVPADFRAGTYTFYIGFFYGENRLPVTAGPKDDSHRAIAGTLVVR